MPHSITAKNGRALVALGSKLLLVENDKIVKEVTVEQDNAPKDTANFVDSLASSPDGKHWVGIDHYGKQLVVYSPELEVESSRVFPKRPSAFAIEGDSVLVGDKFGDVYQVSLTSSDPVCDEKGQAIIEPILGHVSMLLNVEVYDHRRIITGDRDEHIRISSLAHPFVIEQFLFGHKQYVCQLLLAGRILVSGGGDDYVCAWDLESGEQLAQLELAQVFDGVLPELDVSVLVEYQGDVLLVVENTQKLLRLSLPSLEILAEYDLGDKITAVAVDGSSIYVGFANKLAVTKSLPPQFTEIELPQIDEAPLFVQGQLRKRPEH